MKRSPERLATEHFDVVVVGGGAFGCCAAWEAASRGLSVALVERGDFCAATSANHLKMIHGGVRYLQHLDLPRLRESSRERSALLRIAPHLVRPLPIAMPTYGRGAEGRLVLRAGLELYDLLVWDRNRRIGDPSRRLPGGRMISRAEFLERFPGLDRPRPTGAGVFYDGQFFNPPRLALAFLKSAVGAGARVGNYLEVTGFLGDTEKVSGVEVRDRLDGSRFELRARVVLNAAGPWAGRLLRDSSGLSIRPEPTFSRDAGFVVRRRLVGDHALACRIDTRDPDAMLSRRGRHLFLAPWRDYTLVGVWHRVHSGDLDDLRVGVDELESWLEDVRRARPNVELGLDDISMVYAGLTLFGENEPGARNLRFGKRSLLVDHGRTDGLEGLVSLVGVRATTARGMAERAVDLILKKLGKPPRPSRTAEERLHGGAIARFDEFERQAVARHAPTHEPRVVRSLVRNYGSEYETILRTAGAEPLLAERAGDSDVLLAQVVHAVREEMAVKLPDVVLRRTDLGSGGHPGDEAIRACADLMARELGWSEARTEAEIGEVLDGFPAFGAAPRRSDPA